MEPGETPKSVKLRTKHNIFKMVVCILSTQVYFKDLVVSGEIV